MPATRLGRGSDLNNARTAVNVNDFILGYRPQPVGMTAPAIRPTPAAAARAAASASGLPINGKPRASINSLRRRSRRHTPEARTAQTAMRDNIQVRTRTLRWAALISALRNVFFAFD